MRNGILSWALLVTALALAPPRAPAQETAGRAGGPSLVPVLGVVWSGHRWEESPVTAQEDGPEKVGPSSGLVLGAEIEVPVRPGFALLAAGGFSRLSYQVVVPPGRRQSRILGGSQHVYRAAAGASYRLHPAAPGFFSGGVVAQRVDPKGSFWFDEEAARTEIGGYAGVGLDFGSGARRLRAEGRVLGMAPGALDAERGGVLYDPRPFVLDFSLSLGFVLPL